MVMMSHKHIQLILSAFIIIVAIFTKIYTVNYWEIQGITNVYPYFMPYLFIGWGIALCGRLWYEKSRLVSVWVMALSIIWYGFQSFSVAGGL